MGNSTYPYASTATAPYSTQPPVTASSVLLDGQLVGTGSYTTNVTGSGAPWLLYANGASNATFTIGGASYTVTPGSTVGTAAISGSTSVTVASDTLAGTPGAANTGSGGTTSQRYACAFGNNIFVQIGPSISNGGATTVAYYSSDGSSWSTTTTPSVIATSCFYINGYFVAPNYQSTSNWIRSTDGITWTSYNVTTIGSPSAQYTPANSPHVFVGNGYAVYATSPNSLANTSQIFRSTDGVNWTFSNGIDLYNPNNVTFGYMNGVAVWMMGSSQTGGNILSGGTTVAYSTNNGASWTNAFPSGGTGTYWIAMGNNLAVLNNGSTSGYYATTPGAWNAMTYPSVPNTKIWYANKIFIAGLNYNTATYLYSSNGYTWSTRSGNNVGQYNNLAFGKNTLAGSGTVGGTTESFTYLTVPAPTPILPVAYGIYNGATTTH